MRVGDVGGVVCSRLERGGDCWGGELRGVGV